MKLYYIIFAILSILSFFEIFCKYKNKTKKFIEFFVLIIVIFLSAIRGKGIGDYETYEIVFKETNIQIGFVQAMISESQHIPEPLYKGINYVIKYFGGSFRSVIIFEAFFVNILIYILCKKIIWTNQSGEHAKDYTITVFFIGWCLGLYNIIIVRQTIAVAICWYSVRYIQKRNLREFILCCIIAACFHASEIAWMPAYWLYNIDIKKSTVRYKYVMLIILFVFIGLILIKPIAFCIPGLVGEKLRWYVSIGYDSYGQTYSVLFILLKMFVNIGILLVVIMFVYKYFKDDKGFKGLVNIYLMGLGIVVSTSFIANQLSRFSQAYTMISIFIFSYLFKRKSDMNDKLCLFMIFIVYMGVRLTLNINGYAILTEGYPTIWRQ